MTLTPEAVEALARALCRVRSIDPDVTTTAIPEPFRQPRWHQFWDEARSYLELQAAAAMVMEGE